jgi:hypothetical protein
VCRGPILDQDGNLNATPIHPTDLYGINWKASDGTWTPLGRLVTQREWFLMHFPPLLGYLSVEEHQHMMDHQIDGVDAMEDIHLLESKVLAAEEKTREDAAELRRRNITSVMPFGQ